MDDNIGSLRPRNDDAERLSWSQRIVVLEGQMAVVYPAIRGEERPDGTTRPGILRRLESIEASIITLNASLNTSTKVGGSLFGLGGLGWLASQLGIMDQLKHLIVVLFGGHT